MKFCHKKNGVSPSEISISNLVYDLDKIKEAELPHVTQRSDSKTISEAQASTANNILQTNKNIK